MAIDPSGLLRIGLAACAVALLLAASVMTVRGRGAAHRRGALPVMPSALLHALLAALSVALALRPSLEVGSFPAGEAALCLVAATLFSMALTTRRETHAGSARLLDTPTVDALTRIASHRVFQDRLAHECDRAHRFGDTFVLLILDLDDFRPVNDRFGHRLGDRILLESARGLRSQLREIDLVARFGGDRFAMILPHTFEKAGREVAERLRQSTAACLFSTSGGGIRLTASLGLSSYPHDGHSPPALIEAALKALAFAKAMGGNQVQLYRDLPDRGQTGNVVPLPHSGREAIVRSLAAAVDVRDGYTREHSHLVSELSAAIARRIGLPSTDVARISVGALLHDVGKIGVPDAILTKEGSLSPEEWDCIRQHPGLGKRIIEQAPELTDVMPLVLHHQERWDGTGYPEKLQGEEIPLGARIIAVADAYHAIRSDRPYRLGRTHREAMKELRRCSGGQFDPRVIDALIAALDTNAGLRAMLPPDREISPARGPAATPQPAAAPVTAATGRA